MAKWGKVARNGLVVLAVLAVMTATAACSPEPAPASDEIRATTAPPTSQPEPAPAATTPVASTPAPTTPLAAGATAAPAGPAAMMEGKNGYVVDELFTVGTSIDGFQPIGVLDGIGAYELDADTVRLLVNHEVSPRSGYPYELANGTRLKGARITYFDVAKASKEIVDAGVAYDTAYDRSGTIVTDAAQINEEQHALGGFSSFCSSLYVASGSFGFLDPILFTNEEARISSHPHGGTIWALDVQNGAMWGLPELGRGVWENVAPIDTGDPSTIALLLTDDSNPAPLYLWVGNLHPEAGTDRFPYRNGLEDGTLYVWVPDDASDFSGTGESRSGTFVPIAAQDTNAAGAAGHDGAGYKDADTLRLEAVRELGAQRFARPEDVATSPTDGTVAVFAATGSKSGPADWGAVYLVEVDLSAAEPAAVISILHDSNDWGDEGIRNPDNVEWASDGYIYVQEDASHPDFGAQSGRDASIMRLDPQSRDFDVAATMKRSGRFAHALGQWEPSGVLDVTRLFGLPEGELLLVATVQAHGQLGISVLGDQIARSIEEDQLVEGGQLIWVSRS